jgi:hypothetical protein
MNTVISQNYDLLHCDARSSADGNQNLCESTITMGEASYFDALTATYQIIKHQTAMSVMLIPLWETQISLANEPSGPLKQLVFRW